jgi:inosine/xanthosine triphosphatase
VTALPVATLLAGLRQVRVGTTNAPKLAAVRSALEPYAPNAAVEGVAVESGVPAQPLGWEEIVRGACNRARRAGTSGPCDLGVGIEDGLVPLPDAAGAPQHVNVGCAAVARGEQVWLGFSSGFAYPPACTQRAVCERTPIGPLFDGLWEARRAETATDPAGCEVGNVGQLTLGVLPRSEYARQAVLCALVPLLHPDLYPPVECET